MPFESMLKKFYLLEGGQFQFFDLLPSQLMEARRYDTDYPEFVILGRLGNQL